MANSTVENRADRLLSKLDYFKTVRTGWESIWQFISERTDPKNACMTSPHQPGQINRGTQKFDSTATLAVPKWASAIDGLTTPKTQKWHNLILTDENYTRKFKVYLEQATDRLFTRRYAASSNFTNANFDALKQVGHYGGSPFSVTPDPFKHKGVSYKTWPIKEFYIDQNFNGDVDTYYRVYEASARQLRQEYSEDSLPKDILDAKLTDTFEILHAVYPNELFDPASFLSKYKKWASVVVAIKSRYIIEESGSDKSCYIYQRFDVVPSLTDPYAYSPLLLCMPEIRDLNTMIRDTLKTGNIIGNPILLMSEDDLIPGNSIYPGKFIPNSIDSNSNPKIRPLQYPNGLPYTFEMINGFRDVINKAFGLDLFQILVNKPDMTATEVLQRAQEQATLMTPTTSRREKEYLGPLIEKELDIAVKQGDMPEMPQELAELLSSGEADLSIEYESPIRRAQRADSGTAVLRVLQTVSALQPLDPKIKNRINANRTLDELSNIWGAPVRIFNTPEEQAAADMSDAQIQQAQLMLNAAPVIGQSAKDLAQAKKTEGSII